LTSADVELVGFDAEVPPVLVREKGTSRYPFALLEVNHSFLVKRGKSAVKSAVRAWMKFHKGQKFQVWVVADGRTKVKRIK
jgi:hypothetical protein